MQATSRLKCFSKSFNSIYNWPQQVCSSLPTEQSGKPMVYKKLQGTVQYEVAATAENDRTTRKNYKPRTFKDMALSTTARFLLGTVVLCSFLAACTALPVRPTASSPPTATPTSAKGGPAATPVPTVPSQQPLTPQNNTSQQNSSEPEQPSASPKLSPDQHEASSTQQPRSRYAELAEIAKRAAAESSQSANHLRQQLPLDSTPKPVPACFIEQRDPEYQPNSTKEYIQRLVSDYKSLLQFIAYAKQVVQENPREGRLYRDYQRTMTNVKQNTKQLIDAVDSDALEDQGERVGLEEPVSTQCSNLSLQQQYHILRNYLTLMRYTVSDIEGLQSN